MPLRRLLPLEDIESQNQIAKLRYRATDGMCLGALRGTWMIFKPRGHAATNGYRMQALAGASERRCVVTETTERTEYDPSVLDLRRHVRQRARSKSVRHGRRGRRRNHRHRDAR